MAKAAATGGDVTALRLLGIAESVCTECRGVEHAPHAPAGYKVTGMRAYGKTRPDCAVALFGLTRGSVVAKIDGQSSWRWWLPTIEAGQEHYAEVHQTLHILSDPL